jgi:FtsP/CotA-like multicopper oxidase with cupredoxin domain
MGLISGLLVGTLATTASLLDQTITNGASLLGSLQAPVLPKFLATGGAQTIPWGQGNTRNTNPYTQSPNTGKVRKYTFNVARQTLAPDGYERSLIVVNGQYPGPTIEANWGDIIEVTVNNQIQNPEEATAIHFHGFLQHKTPWMDGAPGMNLLACGQYSRSPD